jgi:hypothetical protein
MRGKFFSCLLVAGMVVLAISIVACKADELRKVIEITAEGKILHYQQRSFWTEEDFAKILRSKDNFEAKEIATFRKDLARYNRSAVNLQVEFNKATRSTTFKCVVEGAKEGSWYDFDWFLRPRGLDFLDSPFERRAKELYWAGEINGVRTTVTLNFPSAISNCHEHVWPR